jgi:uncharacterized protein DUF5696
MIAAAALALLAAAAPPAVPPARPTPLARELWGAPVVNVAQETGRWRIDGRRVKVALNAKDLALEIAAGPAKWTMVPSGGQDMRVRSKGKDASVRLADAPRADIERFDTGYKTGVKLVLSGWPEAPGLKLYLTVALEGKDEELAFDVAAEEGVTTIRRLDWPTALDGREVDHTILNHWRGILLPRTWPQAYNPIRTDNEYRKDTSEIQSDVIECWSASWWGFQKGPSAMMVLVETSDDAAYRFEHPAGGPTVIGPRWRAQIGRLGYPRAARMIFFDKGNYVDLAKRYRRYALETGLHVSLKQKIAASPIVEQLIGNVESRISILRDIVPESRLYNKEDTTKNYRLTTFDERAKQLRELKAKGVEKFHVVLTGWGRLGYDREHPDGMPPAPAAGGWEGLTRLMDTCKELGYLFSLHDQYRDYYVEAPSYDPQFAIHEEDVASPPTIFPGTRFGTHKEGRLSFLSAWDGGKQTYLNSRYMLGHMKKNYGMFLERGLQPAGSYLDVFGYVPPDEDWNPEHPTTRTEAKRDRAQCYTWARQNLGLVGTEAGADWSVPYADYSSPIGVGRAGIPVPLFNLVYHDALVPMYSPQAPDARQVQPARPDWMYGMLNGGLPRVGLGGIDRVRDQIDQLTRLHKRVALQAMTNHEFLDEKHEKERTTFADGTTVTVDWTTPSVTVTP